MSNSEKFREKEVYREKIVEIANKISDSEKGELLYRILKILEVLPVGECQRVYSYLSELYFS